MMITLGYLPHDYIVQKYFVRDAQPIMGLVTFHHVLAGGGIVLSLIIGYGFIGIMSFALVAEFSTIFINYRSLYSKKEITKLCPQIS